MVGSAAVKTVLAYHCANLPSNGQPHLLSEPQSSPTVATSDSYPINEFSGRHFLLRLQKVGRQNQPKAIMQLANFGLKMHKDSVRLRVACATPGNAADRFD